MAWRNNRERRASTPSVSAIFKYWSQEGKLPLIRNNEFITQGEKNCFACGDFRNIQRCHIVPLVYGGENEVENLHLLCVGCHADSEGNKYYWNWLTYMRTHEWKFECEWCVKILEMNGVDISKAIDDNIPPEQHLTAISDLLLEHGIRRVPKK